MLASIASEISLRQAGSYIASHRISRRAAAAVGELCDRSHCEHWLYSGFDICGVTSTADLSPCRRLADRGVGRALPAFDKTYAIPADPKTLERSSRGPSATR